MSPYAVYCIYVLYFKVLSNITYFTINNKL